MDFLAKGDTIAGAYYASLLRKFREANKNKRRGMLTKGVRLLRGNAPVHNSHIAQMEARCCGFKILPHSPYSPDLAPSDFHLFPTMKSYLKGKHFPDDETLISKVTTWLLEQPVNFYKRGVYFLQLHKRMGEVCVPGWHLCRGLINLQGFVALHPQEVGQGKSLLNAPRT